MSRRRCCGLVEEIPYSKRFVPDNQRNVAVSEILIEEIESIRLKDVEGLDQQMCAEAMGVSRTTFQRILQRARFKVASALVQGQTILIRGGNYILKNRVFECLDCHHVWDVEPCEKGAKHGYEIPCPACNSMKKIKVSDEDVRCTCGRRHQGDRCCGGMKLSEQSTKF
ncbi:DUF134 domain-containing protein [Pelosinus sp. UFO1]|uniref:DUF134 domain-containing protein n=1 Tax=Pelosinus sp. UFO1 TaxID=484770 RepID=UPI0004D16181|nr:DUF134 domain-containing protein [Pelosinus sp. UFO1]AIF50401.1 protein of unknown function DUF134 [Pelosinus sp. UFO1]